MRALHPGAKAMGDPLSDCSPLIGAAASGKLRLVRLLVEGGAQVNGCNPRGETALLAACKALRGEPAGPDTVKLLTYLLQNKADPNSQDHTGRTALMYACMEQAGAQVASTLLSAGADPSMVDYSGASALVYAINAQHHPTLEVLMDACRARGRDIIIIATEMGVSSGPVTRRYLNVPPSPDTSPVSCMSPSDIVLKTGSPNSPEGENIFNFRGTGKMGSGSSGSSQHPSCGLSPLSQCHTPPPRQRISSEPWLTIHNLACLTRAYEEGTRKRSLQEEGDREDLRREGGGSEAEKGEDEDEESHFHQSKVEERRVHGRVYRHGGENFHSCHKDFPPRVSQSVLSPTEVSSSQATLSGLDANSCLTPGGLDETTQRSSIDKLPVYPSPHPQRRRNAPVCVTVVPPLLRFPPLVNQPDSRLQAPPQGPLSKSGSMGFPPHPPSSSAPSSSSRATFSVNSQVAPPASCLGERSRRSPRRHSVQLEQIRGGEPMKHSGL